jgi:hypothetical protein
MLGEVLSMRAGDCEVTVVRTEAMSLDELTARVRDAAPAPSSSNYSVVSL